MDLVHRIKILFDDPNIIFLDFFVCQPIQRSEAFHLELFRLKVLIVFKRKSPPLDHHLIDTDYFIE